MPLRESLTMSTPPGKSLLNKRRAARFAAIQALYQIELTGEAPAEVVEEFDHHRLSRLLEPVLGEAPSPAVDRPFFHRVVIGASRERARLDEALSSVLASGWSLDRCGFMLRACLRAAAYELAACSDVPVKVVINEYVDLAKLFLPADEPAFVNAVLDRLAPRLRAPAEAL
jgi:N utilization substance protein B